MVRPSACFENKRIALAFAHMVTSPAPASGPARQAVCRTGRYSLYDALSACCPSSVINQDPYVGKYGLRAIEFCKVVESDGFLKVRHQRPRAKGEASSPSGLSVAGAEEVRYVYAGRRWRDPRDEEDMRALREAWEELAGSSTIFAGQCALERVVRVCEEYRGGWAEYQAGLSRPLPSVTRRRGEGGKRRRLDEAGRSSPSSTTSFEENCCAGHGCVEGRSWEQQHNHQSSIWGTCQDDSESDYKECLTALSNEQLLPYLVKNEDLDSDILDDDHDTVEIDKSFDETHRALEIGAGEETVINTLISSIEGVCEMGMRQSDIMCFVEDKRYFMPCFACA
ncbi:hypothetical protein GUITHDRAFT_116840 [Guillardia theta CCMP2712]|uniref:Uncharacterized protein n=1 Tax=Guillardia theta (strain CCMP2712) TaxID=905079 RepID=L1IM44_GUITC|nr:hypothetical protein GUITHDRAFT_116840 [Guillardia theta CCMP2712]EKX36974.1 hypothetical protein GUITHDRAFT_116840 [Guillardia theta CCMP2712]|eukprot:XP_005823954.1 hypothetical protein GUITHDRAFT_116840 [Guillardia theta CCMP2712]